MGPISHWRRTWGQSPGRQPAKSQGYCGSGGWSWEARSALCWVPTSGHNRPGPCSVIECPLGFWDTRFDVYNWQVGLIGEYLPLESPRGLSGSGAMREKRGDAGRLGREEAAECCRETSWWSEQSAFRVFFASFSRDVLDKIEKNMNATLSVYAFFKRFYTTGALLHRITHTHTHAHKFNPQQWGSLQKGFRDRGLVNGLQIPSWLDLSQKPWHGPTAFPPILFNFIDCWWVADSKISQMGNEMPVYQMLWWETSTFVVVQGAPVMN